MNDVPMEATESIADLYATGLDQLLGGIAYIDLRVRWAVARAQANGLNPHDEFRGLYISEGHVATLLNLGMGEHPWAGNGKQGNGSSSQERSEWPTALAQARREWIARTQRSEAAGLDMPFHRLVKQFDLSPQESDILLIALAPEIDPRYERLFAYLQDDVTKKRPTVDLILNLLTDSFAEKLSLRRLFTDDGRLFRSHLLLRFDGRVGQEPTLLSQSVRPAAHLVEHLLEHSALDSRLSGIAGFVAEESRRPPQRLPAEFTDLLVAAAQRDIDRPPVFVFVGGYGVGKRQAARRVADAAGQPLIEVDLAALAASDLGLDRGLALVLRDGRLYSAVLYLTGWDGILEDGRFPPHQFQRLVDYPYMVIIVSESTWYPSDSPGRRHVYTIQFETPDYEQRLQIWQAHLGGDDQQSLALGQLANQFRFTPGQIADAADTARDLARWRGDSLSAADLFAASRSHSNQKLATLATKIQPRYRWQDIILPEDTLNQLREMVNTVRQRPTVYGKWGFGRKVALGKGLNALFAGEPGTGKTMAADILARELQLDLYKIDLSTVVSKYIGETEKNLDRIFTEATTSNAILFFDEADAIFGKRSEVKDSHDRYANIEISYLLQRMESFDGVVILATNLRANLDEAFTRRLHFAVEFPFPEAADRERIWRVNFPAETPIAADVDLHVLATRFRIAGGSIRNIIMAAAFLAAEAGQDVTMSHLLHAARREYQKIGRLIDEALFV